MTITGLASETVRKGLNTAQEEYSARDTFYTKVQKICKEMGIPSPP